MPALSRTQLLQLAKNKSEDFKKFYTETLAESRELEQIYQDLVYKQLTAKVKDQEGPLPTNEAEEAVTLLLEVLEYNIKVKSFLIQIDIPYKPPGGIGAPPILPPWWR